MPALSKSDYNILRLEGFTKQEVDEFNNATTSDGEFQSIDIKTKAWKATRRSRNNQVKKLKAKGWDDKTIGQTIMSYYKTRGDTTPFDFLKIEYKPPRKLTPAEYDKMLDIHKSLYKIRGLKDYGKKGMPTHKQKGKRRQ